MKLFIAQINPVIGDLEGNSQRIFEILPKAKETGADLVLTPELSLWGYPPKDLVFKEALIEKQYKILDELASSIENNFGSLSVIIGIAERINDEFFPNLYNSIVLLEKGKWCVIARKILLPTYEIFDEKRYFRSGKEVSILRKKVGSKIWKLGITICEDLWVNESLDGRGIYKKNPIFELKQKEIDLLLNFSASPFTIKKFEKRMKISISAAQYLSSPLIYVNQVGANDDLIFDGNSFIIDDKGNRVKLLKQCEEDHFCTSIPINTQSVEQFCDGIEMESIFDALVLGVKDYAKKCGFKTALIGLSGGIDSALVSVIATAALGSENIFCVSMPSKWSSLHSKIDAQDLSKRLNIKLDTIPIHQIFDTFQNSFKENLLLDLERIPNENIQSRIRGTLLMALANNNNHLLLSTGNKSELAVGYCTLYGDMNGGLSVIGDLYKTNVFKLCDWIDSKHSLIRRSKYGLPTNGAIIGHEILTKPPSAELGPNQLDTDSLPPYSKLDEILKDLIEGKKDFEQLLKNGHDKDLIVKIISLLKKSEFKRKQAPPILRLSTQSLGNDWRIPIAIY